MAQQNVATDELTASIHWESDSVYSDNSEPLTGTVVEDSRGLLTVQENATLFHRVERTDSGAMVVRSMREREQKDRNTHIKGRVVGVEVE